MMFMIQLSRIGSCKVFQQSTITGISNELIVDTIVSTIDSWRI